MAPALEGLPVLLTNIDMLSTLINVVCEGKSDQYVLESGTFLLSIAIWILRYLMKLHVYMTTILRKKD